VHNNLDGRGPEGGDQCLRFGSLTTVNGQAVELRISTVTEDTYTADSITHNGIFDSDHSM
jgi:hypothetical protein